MKLTTITNVSVDSACRLDFSTMTRMTRPTSPSRHDLRELKPKYARRTSHVTRPRPILLHLARRLRHRPLRPFHQRIRARRGTQIAVVATARKLTVLCWHLVVHDQDYVFARPSLTAKKYRALELRAELPPRRGRKGSAAAYSLKEIRRRENEAAAQAEAAYRQMISGWQTGPRLGAPARTDPALAQPSSGISSGVGMDLAAVTGRDYRGPSRGHGCAARLTAPTPCTSPRGRPRPPPPTLLRPLPGQGRSSGGALHLDPGAGRRITQRSGRVRTDPTTPRGLTLSSVEHDRSRQCDAGSMRSECDPGRCPGSRNEALAESLDGVAISAVRCVCCA
jgi:hypothetical protein